VKRWEAITLALGLGLFALAMTEAVNCAPVTLPPINNPDPTAPPPPGLPLPRLARDAGQER
jgi:hypothetical protein